MSKGSEWVKRMRKIQKTIRGNKCYVCDRKSELQFAHVKDTGVNGRGRGSYKRIKDIIDHPESYVLLCPHHHMQFDMGELQLVLPVTDKSLHANKEHIR